MKTPQFYKGTIRIFLEMNFLAQSDNVQAFPFPSYMLNYVTQRVLNISAQL